MIEEKTHSVFVVISSLAEERDDLRAFAMACAVLGVQLRPVNDFVEKRRMVNGKEVRHVSWYLEQASPDKTQKTNELLGWWKDPEWLAANPTHPLALLKEYWQALKDAKAHEEQTVPIAVVTRGKRHVELPYDIDPERKKQLLQMLNE